MRVPRQSLCVILTLVPTLGCGDGVRARRLEYPATRTVDVVDDYHGTKVRDPYRWLEDVETQEVGDWAAAQTAVALPHLRDNDVRPWLLSRVTELRKRQEEPPLEPAEPALIDESALGDGLSVEDVWRSPETRRTRRIFRFSTLIHRCTR